MSEKYFKDLSKEEIEDISKFLSLKLELRECWHEFPMIGHDVAPAAGGHYCKWCGMYTDDPYRKTRNPSILDANFREEVVEAGKKVESDGLVAWFEDQDGWLDESLDTLTSPDKLILIIAKELGYERS